MTKRELIQALAEMPDEAPVLVWGRDVNVLTERVTIERHEGETGTFADGFIVVMETERKAVTL